ncbi:PAS domain-containing protein [Marinibaculum pumilum]|uniref:PAS domain-containing protein n=1 Tax=Marinibaculum pumilum TaxID=1766165 RepID=A0ABV7KVX4_9PROT
MPPAVIAGPADLRDCGSVIRAGYDYWRGLSARRGTLPLRTDIRPQEMRSLLSRFILLDLYDRDRIELRFRLVGTRFEELQGLSLTGRFLREVYPAADYEEMADVCRQMVTDPLPRYLESELRRPGREMYRVQRLMLPLAASDGRVAHIAAFIDESPSPAGLWGALPQQD